MIGRIERSRIDDDLNAEVLYEEPFHVAVGARNPLADHREVTLAALMNERWMISEASNVVTSTERHPAWGVLDVPCQEQARS